MAADEAADAVAGEQHRRRQQQHVARGDAPGAQVRGDRERRGDGRELLRDGRRAERHRAKVAARHVGVDDLVFSEGGKERGWRDLFGDGGV